MPAPWMRAALLGVACVAGLSMVHGQSFAPGQPFRAEADHDGLGAVSYRLYAQVGADVPASALSGGVVTVGPQPMALAPDTKFYMAAVGEDGQAISAPVEVSIVAGPSPPPAVPQPCPYTSPAGVQSVKAIGSDDVRGWNLLNTDSVVDLRRVYDRMHVLRGWGFDPQILAIDPLTNRVFIFAPCVGYLP
jgi:hypothetical protein